MTTGGAAPDRLAWYERPGRPTSLLRGWFTAASATILFAMSALVLVNVFNSQLSLRAAMVAVLGALLPLGVVVPALLWLDRFENEPVTHLTFAFLWGALVATTVSLVLNTGSLQLMQSFGAGGVHVAALFVAPFVEEALKIFGVLLILWFRRHEFDGIIDGLVYAGLSAAGFAFAENILYLGRAFTELGRDGLLTVFVLRCVLGPFAHPLFSCCAGVGVGLAARRRGPLATVTPFAAYLLAVLLHALWNYSALISMDGFLTRYLALQLPIFIAAGWFASWARAREGRLIARHLSTYVLHGGFSREEVQMLGSMPARRAARRWAAAYGGKPARLAMREFQDDASELALLRERMRHGGATPDAVRREQALLESTVRNRAGFTQLVNGR